MGYARITTTLHTGGSSEKTCDYCDTFPSLPYTVETHTDVYREIWEHQRNNCTPEARASAGEQQIMPPTPIILGDE